MICIYQFKKPVGIGIRIYLVTKPPSTRLVVPGQTIICFGASNSRIGYTTWAYISGEWLRINRGSIEVAADRAPKNLAIPPPTT